MKTIARWFTPTRRQLIQLFFGSLAPIVIGLGFATQAQAEQFLIIVGAALQLLSSLLSLINLRGVWTIWKALRGAVYVAGTTVSPTLVVLGVIDEATNSILLVGLSLGLSSLSSFIAIFVSKDQETEAELAGAGVVVDVNTGDVTLMRRAEYRAYRQARLDEIDALNAERAAHDSGEA